MSGQTAVSLCKVAALLKHVFLEKPACNSIIVKKLCSCEYARLGECRFRAGKKIAEKSIFFPIPENREKSPQNRKNGSKIGYRAIFPIFWRFFPYFPGEAKIDFPAIFFRFRAGGPKSAFSQARILATLQSYLGNVAHPKSIVLGGVDIKFWWTKLCMQPQNPMLLKNLCI